MVLLGASVIHIIVTKQSINSTIFIITLSLILYFTIPLMKNPFINYLAIILLLPVSALTSLELEYILPFFSFFIVDGALHLKAKSFFGLNNTLFIICVGLVIFQQLSIYSFLVIGTLVICSYFLNQYAEDIHMKNEIYEELLSQYRYLKRMSVEQEQLVRSEERTKIARDMHDSVGHKLTALLMQLEMMEIQQGTSNILEIKQLVRESLDETRYAVRQLKSNETTGIQSVIQLIRKLEMESRLHIRFTLEKGVLSLPISNNQSIVLYRVLQESLTNAMKYSDSKDVEVIIGINSLQHVQFEVKNKLMSNASIIHGFGLTNMKERLQEIGGQLRIKRTEQHFIVEGTFPIN